jgi:hypothetical protein
MYYFICLFELRQTLFIADPNIMDFGYNVQNMAVYSCELLEILMH